MMLFRLLVKSLVVSNDIYDLDDNLVIAYYYWYQLVAIECMILEQNYRPWKVNLRFQTADRNKITLLHLNNCSRQGLWANVSAGD